MAPIIDERMAPAIALLGKTGARDFELRFSEPEEDLGGPIIWIAIATYLRTRGPLVEPAAECAAALEPEAAVFRLLDQVIDGGFCTHCKKTTGFDKGFGAMPLSGLVCWWQWDPETKAFRRGCEGDQ